MTTTLAYTLLVMLMYGGAMFLMKVAGSRIDPFTAVVMNLLGYAVLASIALPKTNWQLGWPHLVAVVIGAMYVTGNAAFYKLAQVADVSTLAPLISLNIIIPITLGVLLLGEPITVRKMSGVALALMAGYLLSSETN